MLGSWLINCPDINTCSLNSAQRRSTGKGKQARGGNLAKVEFSRWLKEGGRKGVAREAEQSWAVGVFGNNNLARRKWWPCGVGWGALARPRLDPWPFPVEGKGAHEVKCSRTGWQGQVWGPAAPGVRVDGRNTSLSASVKCEWVGQGWGWLLTETSEKGGQTMRWRPIGGLNLLSDGGDVLSVPPAQCWYVAGTQSVSVERVSEWVNEQTEAWLGWKIHPFCSLVPSFSIALAN